MILAGVEVSESNKVEVALIYINKVFIKLRCSLGTHTHTKYRTYGEI